MTPTSDLTTWIRISDPGSEILGSGSHGSIEKLIDGSVAIFVSSSDSTKFRLFIVLLAAL